MQSSLIHVRTVVALALASVVGIGLFVVGVLRNHTLDYWFLPSNLALALIPLLLTYWLRYLLQRHSSRKWAVVLLAVVWLLFLPNSFYIVTDFVHLVDILRVDLVEDVVMLAQFSFVGMTCGFMSLIMVHQELLKRLTTTRAHLVVAGILLVSSLAIHLGHYLRWNSWDAVVQPAALTMDVIRQAAQPQLYITTIIFFFMLGSIYLILWQLMAASRPENVRRP